MKQTFEEKIKDYTTIQNVSRISFMFAVNVSHKTKLSDILHIVKIK